ncbi:hypothetical protein ACFWPQ_32975 [Streptomyces sp. NPDC058464]|uniref:hypothetical protein n=1 Tax=Streptomyces sp. NPDC058464 TaxID=3346511 RepID=UPI0036536BD2
MAARVGVDQARAAGAGEAEEAPGCGELGAAGLEAGGRVPLRREGEVAEPAAELPTPVDPADVDPGPDPVTLPVPVGSPAAAPDPAAAVPPPVPFAPSSGTSVTDPVGRAAGVPAVPPAAPTAV